MNELKSILIVENQQDEFETIQRALEEYVVYPSDDDYDGFMNIVQTIADIRNHVTRRKKALKQLKEHIEGKHLDLLIIDIKIAPNHDGYTGKELALEMRDIDELENTPVLFLTSTPRNARIVHRKDLKVSNSDWMEKGYAGGGNFSHGYLEKYILRKIREILNRGPHANEKTILEELLLKRKGTLGDYAVKLQNWKTRLDDGGDLSAAESALIHELHALGPELKKSDVARLFTKYGL